LSIIRGLFSDFNKAADLAGPQSRHELQPEQIIIYMLRTS